MRTAALRHNLMYNIGPKEALALFSPDAQQRRVREQLARGAARAANEENDPLLRALADAAFARATII